MTAPQSIIKSPSMVAQTPPSGGGSCDVSSSSSTETTPSVKMSVAFSTVEVREYPRTLGDNPSCTCGPPISLDWGFDPSVHCFDLKTFEDTKPPPREKSEMLVPRAVREAWLTDAGFARSEIAAAVRDVTRAKARRNQTAHNSDKEGLFKIHAAVESLGRKFGRTVLRRKHDGALYEQWAGQGGRKEKTRRTASAPSTSLESSSSTARSWHSRVTTAMASERSSSAPASLLSRVSSAPEGLSHPQPEDDPQKVVELSGMSTIINIHSTEDELIMTVEDKMPQHHHQDPSLQTSGECSVERRQLVEHHHGSAKKETTNEAKCSSCPTCGHGRQHPVVVSQ